MKTDRELIARGKTGRSRLEHFDAFHRLTYLPALTELRPRMGEVKSIFVGGCGYGADVLAASQVFPEANICAVSLGETPTVEVTQALGERLYFSRQTILEFLDRAEKNEWKFDLVMFMNVLTYEFQEMDFYQHLAEIVRPGGHVLTYDLGSIPLDAKTQAGLYLDWMEVNFDRLPLDFPGIDFFHLWRRKGDIVYA